MERKKKTRAQERRNNKENFNEENLEKRQDLIDTRKNLWEKENVQNISRVRNINIKKKEFMVQINRDGRNQLMKKKFVWKKLNLENNEHKEIERRETTNRKVSV